MKKQARLFKLLGAIEFLLMAVFFYLAASAVYITVVLYLFIAGMTDGEIPAGTGGFFGMCVFFIVAAGACAVVAAYGSTNSKQVSRLVEKGFQTESYVDTENTRKGAKKTRIEGADAEGTKQRAIRKIRVYAVLESVAFLIALAFVIYISTGTTFYPQGFASREMTLAFYAIATALAGLCAALRFYGAVMLKRVDVSKLETADGESDGMGYRYNPANDASVSGFTYESEKAGYDFLLDQDEYEKKQNDSGDADDKKVL